MDIIEVISSPLSPWENPYAERLIGSIRRECLDHMIVLGERHLRRILTAYISYYHGARTRLALEKDAPTTRAIQTPSAGRLVRRQNEVTIDLSEWLTFCDHARRNHGPGSS